MKLRSHRPCHLSRQAHTKKLNTQNGEETWQGLTDRFCIQWNPSIAATLGEQHFGRYTGVDLLRGCFVHKLFIWDLGSWLLYRGGLYSGVAVKRGSTVMCNNIKTQNRVENLTEWYQRNDSGHTLNHEIKVTQTLPPVRPTMHTKWGGNLTGLKHKIEWKPWQWMIKMQRPHSKPWN